MSADFCCAHPESPSCEWYVHRGIDDEPVKIYVTKEKKEIARRVLELLKEGKREEALELAKSIAPGYVEGETVYIATAEVPDPDCPNDCPIHLFCTSKSLFSIIYAIAEAKEGEEIEV